MRRAVVSLALAVALPLATSPLVAQGVPTGRFELVPFAGTMFGGAYEVRDGRIEADNALGWGATFSVNMGGGQYLDFTYIREDTDLDIKGPGFGGAEDLGLSMNYIQVGGHKEFARYQAPFRPYIGGAVGLVIYDPEVNGQDQKNETKFSFGLNGGFKYLFGADQRFGIRADMRGMWSWLPSDDWGYWCDIFGCFVVQGTSTVAQGLLSGGLIIRF